MDFFQTIFSNIWAFALAVFLLGLTIFVHELGHFLAARKRGLKVERFSIGFGPKIYGWTGSDGVEYRLSWIPLGGYVALPQLADMPGIEGETKTDVEKLPPLSFSSKVIVAAAGPLFNIIFAFVLSTVLWIAGQQVTVEAQSNIVGNVQATIENSEGRTIPGPAAAAGIKAGDVILAVDGKEVSTFTDAYRRIVLGAGRGENGAPKVTLTIRRGGRTFDTDVTPAYVTPEKIREIGIAPTAKIIAAEVHAGSPAGEAGLKPGDNILRIDGTNIQTAGAIREIVLRSKGTPLAITYMRDGETNTINVTPRLVPQPGETAPIYQIGILPGLALTPVTVRIAPWTQMGMVIGETWDNLATLVNPRSDIGLDKMSGPIGIVQMLGMTIKRSITAVIVLMILINIGLAFFNLLPIPVLDGGHILFAAITKIKGSPLPARFIMTTQSVFMVLLFTMVIYVSSADIRRLVRDFFPSKSAPAQQAPAPTPDSAPVPADQPK
jgi:regulator of sigma E protease